MFIVSKTRSEHRCRFCGATIIEGSPSLKGVLSATFYAVQVYLCCECGIKHTESLLKSLKEGNENERKGLPQLQASVRFSQETAV